MTALANVVIEKVWPGKEGDGKRGPWQVFNFKVEGRDERFGYFWGEGKAIPREGMMLEVLQFTTKQNTGNDGTVYTNHTVKHLEVEGGHTLAQPQKSAQAASQAPKTAPVIHTDVKGTKIGMYACVKAAGNLKPENVGQLFLDAEKIYMMVEDFAYNYRADLAMIERKMINDGIPDGFWTWIAVHYGVENRGDLTTGNIAHLLGNWGVACEKFIESEVAEQISNEDKAAEEEIPFEAPDHSVIPEEEDPPVMGEETDDIPF